MNHQSLDATTCLRQAHRGYATVEILSERFEQEMENILRFVEGRPVDLLNPEIRPLNKL
jgi:hypothetical protein